MPLRPDLARVQPYVPQRPMRELEAALGVASIVKLSSNEGAFGPLPAAEAAYRQAMGELRRYPDGGALELRAALAERHRVPAGQIVIGNGADELIRLCAVATVASGERAVFGWPSFPSYVAAATATGGEPVPVPLAGRSLDLEAIRAAAAEAGTKVVYLANPNNPTGTALAPGAAGAFLDALAPRILCVLDEAYAEYAEPEPEGIDLVRSGAERLCVLRTFSKVYGLASLRIGYAVASPDIAAALDRVRTIFNVNGPAQAAALASLREEAEVGERIRHARAARSRLAEVLRAAGLDPEPSQANFVYADVPGGDGPGLADRLLREGVAVRALDGFGASHAIRVTVGRDEENAKFAHALGAVVGRELHPEGARSA